MVETKADREERQAIATLRRESAIEGIKAVHAMIARVNSEPAFITEFLLNVDSIDVLWSQFKAEDHVLLELLVKLNKSLEYPVAQAGELRVLINSAKAVENINHPTHAVKHNVGTTFSRSDLSQCQTSSLLPEIPLPRFGGEFHLWPSFRDNFTNQVDSRTKLSNVDKLYYLTGCLCGAALDAICGIPASDDTYQLAWSTLSARFYRPRIVATALIEKIVKAPSSSQESLHDLTAFLTTFDENISLLFAMDIPDLGSFILFTMAFRTLPLGTRKLFESTISSNVVYPSVDTLLQFVRGRITVLENVGKPHKFGAKSKPSPVPGPYVSRRSGKSKPVTLIAAKPTDNLAPSDTGTCSCCSGPHTTSSCPKLRSWSVEGRNRWANDNKVCFNCISVSHWIRACPSKSRCQKCSKKHHTLLHGDVCMGVIAAVFKRH